jgi:hypothetical protein
MGLPDLFGDALAELAINATNCEPNAMAKALVLTVLVSHLIHICCLWLG